MEKTINLGLNKQEPDDIYDVQIINENMDIIDEKVQECFQSVSDGKSLVASAISDKGVATQATDTFATMANNVSAIKTDPKLQAKTVELLTSEQVITAETGYDGLSNVTVPAVTGSATESDVIAGKTFGSSSGVSQEGTLPDKTGVAEYIATASLDNTNSELEMTIPATGKYNTSNKLKATFSTIATLIGLTSAKLVNGNTVLGISGNSNNMDTSSADAAEANILSGKKAGVKGSLLTGTMPNNGTVTKTLDTSTTSVSIAKGYHDGNGKVSITTETKTVTLSTSASQDITPSTGKVLSKVTVPKVNLQSKSASLSTSAQTIKPDSAYNGLSQVSIPAVAGNAAQGNVLSGKTFNSATAGIGKSGTMANKAGTTVATSGITQDDTYTYAGIPAAGYYDTNSKVRIPNSDLGSYKSGYITANIAAWNTVELGFKPSKILIINMRNVDKIENATVSNYMGFTYIYDKNLYENKFIANIDNKVMVDGIGSNITAGGITINDSGFTFYAPNNTAKYFYIAYYN